MNPEVYIPCDLCGAETENHWRTWAGKEVCLDCHCEMFATLRVLMLALKVGPVVATREAA